MAYARLFVCFALMLAIGSVHAGSAVDDLKREVETLRKEIAKRDDGKSSPIGKADAMTNNKYGPNSAVTTKNGKLQVGGLIQVWYQTIQNDHDGILRDPGDPTVRNMVNETFDNDTFRIRRTELRFTMDIHENVTAYVMIDPARRSNIMFQPLPTFSLLNEPFDNKGFLQTGTLSSRSTPSLLQDAYINYHGVVPHHDFTIGQFKPPSGEESWRNSGQLDFVERAMATNISNVRDIGVMVHGTWLDNRVQYWFGLFNGPSSVLEDPEFTEHGNRTDDNDDKDFAWRIAVRPVWNAEKWYGRLELGYARTDGFRGEAGSGTDSSKVINGLNQERTAINRQSAWAWYRPAGPVKGWWFRGEWASFHDRYPSTQPTNALNLGGETLIDDTFGIGSNNQANPTPVTVSGWYFSTGYKLSDSIWADHLKGCGMWSFAHDLEFAFRYETFQNIATEDLNNSDRHTDQFKTSAYTAGVNYYIKGHDAKIQANYIWLDEPNDNQHGIHEIKNNTFVVNFQVMF